MEEVLTAREKEILEKVKELGVFEWWQVPASPMELSKLVCKGSLQILGKKDKRNQYRIRQKS